MKYLRLIIPFIFALITWSRREIVTAGKDFEWSDKSLTYNVFRVYELIFGRRYGIKHEMSKDVVNNITFAHSWEAVFALAEECVRQYFRSWEMPRVYIPVLKTPQGISIPASPFLFAIAFDNSASMTGEPISTSYTITGSNIMMIVAGSSDTAAGTTDPWPTNCSQNGVNLTQLFVPYVVSNISTRLRNAVYYLAGASTGTFALTWTASMNNVFCFVASYSGVSQTGFPDSSALADSGAGTATSWDASTTVVAANSWWVVFSNNDSNTTTPGTGINRQGGGIHFGITDSNAAVAAGSQSVTLTVASGTPHWAWYMLSMAPPGAAVAAPKSIISDFIIFN